MTKVVIHDGETPSEAIVKAANKVGAVTDSLGRVIKFRKMGAGQKQRWAAVMGDLVANPVCSTQGFYAFAVTEIDGEQIYPPATYPQLLAMIDRLDEEGLDAIDEAYVAAFGRPGQQIDPDAVKNG